jgi:hypothetical protein
MSDATAGGPPGSAPINPIQDRITIRLDDELRARLFEYMQLNGIDQVSTVIRIALDVGITRLHDIPDDFQRRVFKEAITQAKAEFLTRMESSATEMLSGIRSSKPEQLPIEKFQVRRPRNNK